MPKSGKLDKGDKHSFKRTLSEKFSGESPMNGH